MTDRLNGEVEGVRLRKRRRPRKWTEKKRTTFLVHLSENCNVSAAAREAKMDRCCAYDLKDRDSSFAAGWRKALEKAHGDLELRLLEVSKEGYLRTEATLDPKTGEVTQIKLVHGYPLAVALRLFLSHRLEVSTIRADWVAQDAAGSLIDAGMIVRMNEVRARLFASGTGTDLVNWPFDDGKGDAT